jgi:enamine deaminase RidA (YjgF/YER057c/UK114 family)
MTESAGFAVESKPEIRDLDVRTFESGRVKELYISGVPLAELGIQKQADRIFSAIQNKLLTENARILQERIFVTADALEVIQAARKKNYGSLDDGVSPTFLVPKEPQSMPFLGVQVHAVGGDGSMEVVEQDGVPCGRVYKLPDRTYLTLSALCGESTMPESRQAEAMLEKAGSVFKKYNTDMRSVARTWMWLGDILSWYNEFNQVRNQFFTDEGILGANGSGRMPASTGIGLHPPDGACTMEIAAVLEPAKSIEFLAKAGKQKSAFNYGSAFSRASRAITPAGQTVFVSGTASIDQTGATTHIDNPLGQIDATIENVRAVLGDTKCREGDVVAAIAYCKTAEVEKLFNMRKKSIHWPWITVRCDICRSDLLFEIEVTAVSR